MMSENKAKEHKTEGATIQPSSPNAPFFKQKQTTSVQAPELKETPQVAQTTQEISLKTPIEYLLFAILKELQISNAIEREKFKSKQNKKQEESKIAQEEKEQDEDRFEKVRGSMYM